MKISALIAALAVGTAFSTIALAQAPAGSTGECKDGTYTSAEHKQGACKGHGGVKSWYAEADKKSGKSQTKTETKTETKSQTTAAPATTTAPATAPAKPADTKTASKSSSNMRAEAAPGGGAGKVWVNTPSKVYHCQGDEWYGKTKQGEYMTEAQAKAQGARPSHGKACG